VEHVLPLDGGAHGDELPRLELERIALVGRHLQGDGSRMGGFGFDGHHGQVLKMGGAHAGVLFNGA
jgi:hypothetical protein